MVQNNWSEQIQKERPSTKHQTTNVQSRRLGSSRITFGICQKKQYIVKSIHLRPSKPNHVMCRPTHENNIGLVYVLLPRIPATALQSKFGFLLECNMDSLFGSSTCISEGVNFSLRNWMEMTVGSYPLNVGLQSGMAGTA